MRHILFVTATLEPGGIASVLADLTKQLQGKYDITILLNDDVKISYSYGGNVITLGMRQQNDRTSVWYQLKVFLKRTRALRKLKKTSQYDVCISMLDSANVANILSGNHFCKVITTVFSNISSSKNESRVRHFIIPAIKCLYNRSDYMIITSEGVKRDLVNNYGLNNELMKVIYDGVDIEHIVGKAGEEPERVISGKDDIFISTLGRLDTAKAQWHMIRAMKKVTERYPNAVLLVMGDGSLKKKLEDLILQCGLENNVRIMGYVENPFQFIAKSRVFLMSSVYEGYPTVLLEAMVCGTPCICTDFESGAREILAPDTDIRMKQTQGIEHAKYGVITPVCDGIFRAGTEPLTKEEGLFADAIIEMISDEKLHSAYCDEIKPYAKGFSIESCAKEWEKVIEMMCKEEKNE
jgi:glycosyltransferase involved in cell wall biosynthesis